MGLFVEFDVVDDFGYLDMTEEYAIVPDYSEGCQVFADTFLEIAQQLVPVDTGYLRSTLTAEGYDTYCCAETDCEYAQYPEFGTWCQAEQPYFRPALELALKAAQPYWDQAELEALEEEQALLEEEQAEEQALMQMQSQSQGPQSVGGINFSSPAAFIGSIIGAFIAAVIIVTVQAMLGKDFSSSGKGSKHSIGGNAGVYIPDVIIT